MNKPVRLEALGMAESRDKPKGVSWWLFRKHWHALISAERAMREHYRGAEAHLRGRL